MRLQSFLSVFITSFGLFFLIACDGNSTETVIPTDTDTTVFPPVETKAPNSNYKPAFVGQTRIKGAKTNTAFKADKIAEGLGSPWAVVPMPNSNLLITDRSGFMQIRSSKTGALVKKITGLPAVDFSGQGGLLDVALDPAFSDNKIIYWSFSEKQGTGNLTAVAKGKLNEATGTVESATVIFRATPAINSSLHFGSRLVFDKEANLFVSTGERSTPEGRQKAQDLSSGCGKIIKITRGGTPAPGNPFLGISNALPHIYALGIRNAQSLDIHPETGELWEAEFGPRGGDEINIIKSGKNYGWPVITYGIEYGGEKVGKGIQQQAGMEQPIYYWDPVVSPGGMSFYKDDAIPEWKNNLFIGCLSGSHIVRLIINKNKVVGEERLLEGKGERFRDIACFDGAIFAVTDGGSLYKIAKK